GAPAVKEIKPTAAISWKRVAYGEVRRGGRPIERFDATRPVPLGEAFDGAVDDAYTAVGETLEGVYLDAGENGLFSLPEFEALTALGLMEYITPEEIAENVIREVGGHPTGRDVVAALDAATSGPTYRAGVLRQRAIDFMESLERERGVEAVAYEMLGPPRLTKLLFEGSILARLYDGLASAVRLDPEEAAGRAAALIDGDADLRQRILTVGLPILLPDGDAVLRGPTVKVAPEAGRPIDDARAIENGWVDLRVVNWRRWRERLVAVEDELRSSPGVAEGSRADVEEASGRDGLRPGRLAAWVLRTEDGGERIKR
ncbi:MAG: short-chain dehydrogenase, partial [Gemmatimonadota bacterium]